MHSFVRSAKDNLCDCFSVVFFFLLYCCCRWLKFRNVDRKNNKIPLPSPIGNNNNHHQFNNITWWWWQWPSFGFTMNLISYIWKHVTLWLWLYDINRSTILIILNGPLFYIERERMKTKQNKTMHVLESKKKMVISSLVIYIRDTWMNIWRFIHCLRW